MSYLDDLEKRRKEQQATDNPSMTQQTSGAGGNSSYLDTLSQQRQRDLEPSRVSSQDQPVKETPKVEQPVQTRQEPVQTTQTEQESTQSKPKQNSLVEKIKKNTVTRVLGEAFTIASNQVSKAVEQTFDSVVRGIAGWSDANVSGTRKLLKTVGKATDEQVDKAIPQPSMVATVDRLKASGETSIEISDTIKVPYLPNLLSKVTAQTEKSAQAYQPDWIGDWNNAPLKEKFGNRFFQTLEVMGTSVAGSAIAVLATKKLSGSTLVGTSVLGASTAKDVIGMAKEAGVSNNKAEALGIGVGTVVTLLEKIGFDQLLGKGVIRNFGISFFSKIIGKKAGPVVAKTVTSMLVESSTEVAQEEIQMFAEQTFRDIGVDERTSRDLMSAYGGLLSGLFVGGPVAIMEANQSDTSLVMVQPNGPDGAGPLDSLSKLGAEDSYYQSMLNAAKEKPNDFAAIMDKQGKAIGLTQFEMVGDKSGYMANIVIAPEYRGKGDGVSAVKNIFEMYPKLQNVIGLSTSEAKTFWQSLGATFSENDKDGLTPFQITREGAGVPVKTEVNPNVKPVGPAETTEPKPSLVEVKPSAEIRDRVATLTEQIQNPQTVTQATEAQAELINTTEQLKAYQDSNAITVLEKKLDTDTGNTVAIKVMPYSDGKYSVSVDATTQSGGTTMNYGQLFDTQAAAQQAGVEYLQKYIDSQSKNDSLSAKETNQLLTIQNEIAKLSGRVKPVVKEYSGTAYRSPSGFEHRGTVQDIIDFEADQAGNEHVRRDAVGAARAAGINLADYPASQAIWVTRTADQAQHYGDNVETIDVPKGSIVLADLGDDGLLILQPGEKQTETPQTAKEVATVAKTKSQPMLDKIGKAIAEKVGGDWIGVSKSEESIAGKSERKGYSVLDMKDHARGTIILKDLKDIPQAIKLLLENSFVAENAIETPLNDFGYRGLHFTARFENGLGAEIQLLDAEGWRLKTETSDKIYEKWRSVNASEMTKEQVAQKDRDQELTSTAWKNYWSSLGNGGKAEISSLLSETPKNDSPALPRNLDHSPLLSLNSPTGVTAEMTLPSNRTNVDINTPFKPSIAENGNNVNATETERLLLTEAKKYKSADEFVSYYSKNTDKIPTTPEYQKYLQEQDAFVEQENGIYAEMKAMRDKYVGKTIDEVPAKDIAKYDNLQKELNQTLSKKTLANSPDGIIKTHIGEKGLKSQLTDIWNKANNSYITANADRGMIEFYNVKAPTETEVTGKMSKTIDDRIKELQEICL